MNNYNPALNLAQEKQQQSVAALAELVRLQSPTGEEGQAQQWMAHKLKTLDAEVQIAEPDIAALFARWPDIAQYPTHWQYDLILPYEELPSYQALRTSGLEDVLNYRDRPNVVGILHGSGGGRSLVLNGHIDTVTIEPQAQWNYPPYGAQLKDGKMYGRGTSDMKGGLMAALLALHYLQEAGIKLRGDVIFQSVVNEEHSGNGTLDLVRRGINADAALVLEPTDNQMFVSHPGGLYWQLTAGGIPRSPGARWQQGQQQGISAIETLPALIRSLLQVEQQYNRLAADGENPFSLVMGKISGGHYETVTASEVVLRGGAYFAPDLGTVTDVMQCFRQAIGSARQGDPLLALCPPRFEFLHHDDGMQQDMNMPLAACMGEVLHHYGSNGTPKAGAFCCDARHLVNRAAIPSLIFGPGSIAQAHKPDEHIELASYLAAIVQLIEFIAIWCNLDAIH